MQSIVGASVSSNAMDAQARAERLAWCGAAALSLVGCQHSAAHGLKRLLLHDQPCHGALPLRAGHLEGAVEHKSGLSEEHAIASQC